MTDQNRSSLPEVERDKGLLETLIDSVRLMECTARHQGASIESLHRRIEALEQAATEQSDERGDRARD